MTENLLERSDQPIVERLSQSFRLLAMSSWGQRLYIAEPSWYDSLCRERGVRSLIHNPRTNSREGREVEGVGPRSRTVSDGHWIGWKRISTRDRRRVPGPEH